MAVLLAGLQSCKVQTVSSRKSAVTSPEWTYDVGNRAGKESVPARTAELLAEARKWLGTKYRYGGHSRSGTDCSGMIMELFQKVYGLKLPRSSAQQREYCSNIGRDELQAGDLMFFDTSKGRRGVSHVGLYMGNGEMIHASSSRGVIISRIDERYYTDKYHSSGRVLASSPKKTDTEGGGKTRVKSFDDHHTASGSLYRAGSPASIDRSAGRNAYTRRCDQFQDRFDIFKHDGLIWNVPYP